MFFKFQSFLVKEKMDKKNVQNGFPETKVGIHFLYTFQFTAYRFQKIFYTKLYTLIKTTDFYGK